MKILLVDDHPLFCLGFAQAIGDQHPAHQVLTASVLADGLALAQAHDDLDLVLIDYKLSDEDGLEGVRAFGSRFPWLTRVLISGECGDALMTRAKSAGASGFLNKALPVNAMVLALQELADGKAVYCSGTGRSPSPAAWTMPTLRQLDVLALLAQGFPNKKIANELGIAERTVKLHVSALLESLGARSRTHLLVVARDRGLI